MARLYSNENFPLEVVLALRAKGHDVLTASEAGNANIATPDDQVIAYAVETQRTLLTINRWDFVREHKRSTNHFGIIACTQDSDTRGQAERIHNAIKDDSDMRGKLIRINRPQNKMKPRLTIIGLGRLGTSIGLALKKTGAELEIVGNDKDRQALAAAQKAGAVDKAEWNLYNACEGAGLIVLSMPLAGVLENIGLLKDDVPPGAIVTDTASVKMPVLEAAKSFKPGVHFIGGNPIFRPPQDGMPATTEPDADLFSNALYCLTPDVTTDPDAVQVMTGFVSMLGAKPLFLDAIEHDGLAAGAQHLPLLTENILLKTTTASRGWRELNKFAGVEFFDATTLTEREAASAAQMLIAQREPLQLWLDQYVLTLRELRGLLAQNDIEGLRKWLAAAQDARAQWVKNEVGASTQTVDLSEVRSGALRLFIGGLATRFGGEKKK